SEESVFVENELKKRKEKFESISTEFLGHKFAKKTPKFVIERLRLEGERFWNDYLSNGIWITLHQSSRENLVDSFVIERFIEKEVLKVWSSTVLALSKVIELELSISLFNQFTDILQKSEFSSPE